MARGLFLFFFLEVVAMAELYLWCVLVAVTYGAVVTVVNSRPY